MHNINNFLLPYSYRKRGLYLIFLGIPAVLLLFTTIVFQVNSPEFKSYWDHFGGYLLHLPLSIGLFWLLFAIEKEEDEMYQNLRMKATFHGIRFIFIAILFLPAFSLLRSLLTDTPLRLPDIGGNMAVVTLMLTYANASYYIMKRKLKKDEE